MNNYFIVCLSISFLCVIQSIASVVTTGKVNAACQNIADCPNSLAYFCDISKTCKCKTPLYFLNKFEKCVAGVNQRCLYDENCVEGAYCQNQKLCKCKENYIADQEGRCNISSNSTVITLSTIGYGILFLFALWLF